MRLLDAFKRRKPEHTAVRQIQIVRSTDMRLSEWTVDQSLVSQAHKWLSEPIGQAVVAVLRNESPSNYGVTMGANHDDRIAHACRAEGYQMCMNNLEALTKLSKPAVHIESTFAKENDNLL